MHTNNLKIAEGEKLYLDGVELKNVEYYTLHHSARNMMEAELTVKLNVIVNQSVSKKEEHEAEQLEQASSYLMVKEPCLPHKIEEQLQDMSYCRIRKLVEEEKKKIRQGQYPEWKKIFGVCNSKSRILRAALKELL